MTKKYNTATVAKTNLHMARLLGVRLPASPLPPALDDTFKTVSYRGLQKKTLTNRKVTQNASFCSLLLKSRRRLSLLESCDTFLSEPLGADQCRASTFGSSSCSCLGAPDGCRWARPDSTRTAGRQVGNSVGPIPGPRTHDQHREKDREMLARGKELDGDKDKLLMEYQQDTDTDADMDMDIESDQLGEFNQKLKDSVDEPQRLSRRESLRESLRAWLRVQVCLRESQGSIVWIQVCISVSTH